MNKLDFAGKALAWALPMVLLSSCGCRQDALLEARFSGLDSATVYIKAVPVSMPDSVAMDTLRMTGGVFSWNQDLTTPTEVIIEMDKDRRMQRGREVTPMVYKVAFLAVPGEKVRLDAKYEDGFLSYTLDGSASLQMQSRLRNSLKETYMRSQQLSDQIAEALAEGVENANEQYVDSLSVMYSEAAQGIRDASLDYIRENPSALLSAFFLLQNTNPDTFLTYYAQLANSARDGLLSERLEKARAAAEHRLLIRENDAKLVPGSLVPVFTLSSIDGKMVELSDYADKYVVLDFWGTWCPWCIKGLPEMKAYQAKYKDKVVFISIACRDKVEKVRAMVKAENMNWINVMNGTGDKDVALAYGVSGFPTKVLLEPGLRFKAKYLGEVPEFYEALDNLK